MGGKREQCVNIIKKVELEDPSAHSLSHPLFKTLIIKTDYEQELLKDSEIPALEEKTI